MTVSVFDLAYRNLLAVSTISHVKLSGPFKFLFWKLNFMNGWMGLHKFFYQSECLPTICLKKQATNMHRIKVHLKITPVWYDFFATCQEPFWGTWRFAPSVILSHFWFLGNNLRMIWIWTHDLIALWSILFACWQNRAVISEFKHIVIATIMQYL